LPQAEFQTIKNCGHLAMFEREGEFVEAIRKFCQKAGE
jgi:pimeloyl-ACP methyl ester carboxylesterase